MTLLSTVRIDTMDNFFMKALKTAPLILLIIGGINWLLVGLFRFDIVAALFGHESVFSRIIYVIVGICALYCFTLLPKIQELSKNH
ncbi:DUF378 domain-containing protein [Candidatus Williamhamiltonella defendens]|nr:DUF378 domain-containing protein [Candidatus Hamiltonella defensa]